MTSSRVRRASSALLFLSLCLALAAPGPARADSSDAPGGHMGEMPAESAADMPAGTARVTGSHAHHSSRPDEHAPIGVMGDHTHGAGDVMFSYRYSRMSMRGHRDGTARVSTSAVLRDYPISPTSMTMEMHMLGAMWAPNDHLTLMAMLPFQRLSMKHRTRLGKSFTTRANGIGDVKLWGLVPLWAREDHTLHLNAGLSIPTGSISVKDDTPAGRQRLPYPMQLGSGTWDLLPGLTYYGRVGETTFGAQGLGILRTSRTVGTTAWGTPIGSMAGWPASCCPGSRPRCASSGTTGATSRATTTA